MNLYHVTAKFAVRRIYDVGKEGAEHMKRKLKIETTGDFAKNKIAPKIRIQGKWLWNAGFQPGAHIEVTIKSPGQIILDALPIHELKQTRE